MRSTLIFFMLTCVPTFCQDSLAGQKFNDNLRQRVNDILKSQNVRNPGGMVTSGTRLPQFAAVTRPTQACAIPLLRAVAPGTPVPMPGAIMPDAVKRTNPPTTPNPIDHMRIAVPAPACLGEFRNVPIQLTAPPTRP